MKANGGAKKPAGGGPLIKDASATAATNLTVLRRTDADVEEVLGTAGHVCLYGFDVDSKQWVRARLWCARVWHARARALSTPGVRCACVCTCALQSRKEVEGSMFVVKRCVACRAARVPATPACVAQRTTRLPLRKPAGLTRCPRLPHGVPPAADRRRASSSSS
jgi:hypothetical protein